MFGDDIVQPNMPRARNMCVGIVSAFAHCKYYCMYKYTSKIVHLQLHGDRYKCHRAIKKNLTKLTATCTARGRLLNWGRGGRARCFGQRRGIGGIRVGDVAVRIFVPPPGIEWSDATCDRAFEISRLNSLSTVYKG
eukprot:scaffold28393_cov31-Tisochrysis_lutea.AAC.3